MATEGTTRMHILIPPTINESVSFRIVILFLPFQKSIRRNGSHREVDQSGNSLRVGTRTGSGYHCHSDWFAARVVLGDIPFTKVDDGKSRQQCCLDVACRSECRARLSSDAAPGRDKNTRHNGTPTSMATTNIQGG